MCISPTIYPSPPASSSSDLRQTQLLFPARSNFAAARYNGNGIVPIPLPTPDSSPVKASFPPATTMIPSGPLPTFPPPAAAYRTNTHAMHSKESVPLPLPPLPIRFPSSSLGDTRHPPQYNFDYGASSSSSSSQQRQREELPLTPPASASYAQADFKLARGRDGGEEMKMEELDMDSPEMRMRELVDSVLVDDREVERSDLEDAGAARKMVFELTNDADSGSGSESESALERAFRAVNDAPDREGRPRSLTTSTSGSGTTSSTSTTDALGSLLSHFPHPPLPRSFQSTHAPPPPTTTTTTTAHGMDTPPHSPARGDFSFMHVQAPIPVSRIDGASLELRAQFDQILRAREREVSLAAPRAPAQVPSMHMGMRTGSTPRPPPPPPLRVSIPLPPTHTHIAAPPPSSTSFQSLLTPDGKCLASQYGPWVPVDVSSGTSAGGIILRWPSGFRLPHPGEVRPYAEGTVVHPPIMNTGNVGPIQAQVGDWHCGTCGYTNWRRRRICQGCWPCTSSLLFFFFHIYSWMSARVADARYGFFGVVDAEGNVDMGNSTTVEKVNMIARTLLATALAEASVSAPRGGGMMEVEGRRYHPRPLPLQPYSAPMARSQPQYPFPSIESSSPTKSAFPPNSNLMSSAVFPSSTAFRSSRASSMGTGYGMSGGGRSTSEVSPPLRSAPATSARFFPQSHDIEGVPYGNHRSYQYEASSPVMPLPHPARRLHSSSSSSNLNPTVPPFTMFGKRAGATRSMTNLHTSFDSRPSPTAATFFPSRSAIDALPPPPLPHHHQHATRTFPPSPATTSSTGSMSFSSSTSSSRHTMGTSEGTSPHSTRSFESLRRLSAGSGKWGAIGERTTSTGGSMGIAPLRW